jgi:predicted transposase YdaD
MGSRSGRSRNGSRQGVSDMLHSALLSAEKIESLWIGYALATKVLKNDLPWLRKRFAMLNDFLRDSPAYQEVLAEGSEKGLKEGELLAQRRTLLDIVQERFPEIVPLAKKQAESIEDPEMLRHLTVKMSIVQTSKEAEQYLLSVRRDENRH